MNSFNFNKCSKLAFKVISLSGENLDNFDAM